MDPRQKALAKFISRAFFYFHFFIYAGINALLIAVNKTTSPEIPWFILPLSVWGIFLFLHFGIHFFIESRTAREWRRAHLASITPGPLEKDLPQRELKKRRAARLFFWLAFYFHLSVYLLVSLLLISINKMLFTENFWLLPCAAWGLLVLIHYLLTFTGFAPQLEKWRAARIIKLNAGLPLTRENIREATIFFGFQLVCQAHAVLFGLVIIFLFGLTRINSQNNAGWLLYPLGGWGIILLAHWLVTTLIIKYARKNSAAGK